jgi:hypothetical protein
VPLYHLHNEVDHAVFLKGKIEGEVGAHAATGRFPNPNLGSL